MQGKEQGWNSALVVFFLLENISGNIVSAGQMPILGMAQKASGSDFRPNVKVLRRWGRREIACVKMETTSTSGSNLLKNLCEQYDQELASTEVDLDVHEKLIKLMRDNSTINKEQLLSAQKNAKETEKELQLLDDMTNELVQSTSLQGEKIEELKHVQQENMNDITNGW
ncbi:unnamed protein product [Brugia timori]|uniref:t-SNARE coiled-coil homology domain-containing protein n=1 Tax=Brugia timori TaxID=42155 RepID=A0A0R3R7G6_9BILA|nr:unnamed protein product [Brugia timori]